ncbi:hypothetical protein IGI04_015445, partial [Brassica rapa subsp. trilocularis]
MQTFFPFRQGLTFLSRVLSLVSSQFYDMMIRSYYNFVSHYCRSTEEPIQSAKASELSVPTYALYCIACETIPYLFDHVSVFECGNPSRRNDLADQLIEQIEYHFVCRCHEMCLKPKRKPCDPEIDSCLPASLGQVSTLSIHPYGNHVIP